MAATTVAEAKAGVGSSRWACIATAIPNSLGVAVTTAEEVGTPVGSAAGRWACVAVKR